MRVSQRLWITACLAVAPAAAQSASPPPLFDVGVSFVNDSLLSTQNGGSIEGTYFFKNQRPLAGGVTRDGIVVEFAGSGNVSARLYTLMFGLRWGIETRRFYIYSGPAMVGGSRVDTWGLSNAGVPVSLVRNSFAGALFMTGIELKLGEHFAIKLLENELPLVRVPIPSTGHGEGSEDVRDSAGIVYRFGRP